MSDPGGAYHGNCRGLEGRGHAPVLPAAAAFGSYLNCVTSPTATASFRPAMCLDLEFGDQPAACHSKQLGKPLIIHTPRVSDRLTAHELQSTDALDASATQTV